MHVHLGCSHLPKVTQEKNMRIPSAAAGAGREGNKYRAAATSAAVFH